ncbi:MAG: hypothetical protein GX159_08530 [Flavobacteriaceae bacterium]|nr:hypothetical protein [Flavobacteriaceae bacterium]
MFNENEWFKSFFQLENKDFDLSKIESAKNFVLFWSLFERYFCDKEASLRVIDDNFTKLSDSYSMPSEITEHYYELFRNRYTSNGVVNSLIESLNFRKKYSDPNYKSKLIEILENDSASEKDKVFACFIIIYRYRNNLFHGSKRIANIETQLEIFENSNNVIAIFLDFLKSSSKLK